MTTTHDTDPTTRRPRALPGSGSRARRLEAGVHRRPRPEAAAADDRRPRHRRRCWRRSGRQGAVRPARGRPGRLLLRGRPRRLLAASLPAVPGRRVTSSSTPPASRSTAASGRAKSDRLDAIKLVEMLIRWHNGEPRSGAWSMSRTAERRGSPPDAPRADRAARPSGPRTSTHQGAAGRAGAGRVVVDERLPRRLENCGSGTASRSRRACTSGSSASSSGGGWSTARSPSWRRSGGRRSATTRRRTSRRCGGCLDLKGIGENGAWLLV